MQRFNLQSSPDKRMLPGVSAAHLKLNQDSELYFSKQEKNNG